MGPFLHDASGSLFVATEFSDLLAEGAADDLNQEQRRFLQTIHDRAFMVHDILELLRVALQLHEQELDISPRVCTVPEIVDQCRPGLLRRAHMKVGHLEIRAPSGLPSMWCDAELTRLCLLSLFFHVTADLDSTCRLRLYVERAASTGQNVFRVLVESEDPSLSWTSGSLPGGSAYDQHFHTYEDLAEKLAARNGAQIRVPGPETSSLAELVVPVAATNPSSL